MAKNKNVREHHPGDDCNACREYRQVSRRDFLRRTHVEVAGQMMPIAWLPSVALRKRGTGGGPAPDILVSIFLWGGTDYLSRVFCYNDPAWDIAPWVHPLGEPHVYPDGLRPIGGDNIGIDDPDENDPDPEARRCLHIGEIGTDLFGLNKAYADRESGESTMHNTLYDLYQANEVAFISCAGSPDLNRSHFQARSYIEYGTPNQQHDEFTGWLARLLAVLPDQGSPMRAAAMPYNRVLPKQLAFAERTQVFKLVSDVALPGNPDTEAQRKAIIAERFDEQTQEPLKGSVLDALATADLLSEVEVNPHPDARYTNTDFGRRLMHAAAMIKEGVNLEAVYCDRQGWDNHSDLGPHKYNPVQGDLSGGGMYNRLKEISQNMAAFRVDLQGHWHRITLFEMTEFGRQINQNASLGTDHANAGMITVMGGNVNGGVYCRKELDGEPGWPGLHPDQVPDPDALRTTFDYRAVLREVFLKRMNVSQAEFDFIFNTADESPAPVLDDVGIISA